MMFAVLILGLLLGFQTEFPELSPLDITPGDIVAIAIEYRIIQEDNPTFCQQYYGMTDYASRTIAICSLNDYALQRRTLLHEIVHIMYWKRGIHTGGALEHAVEMKADELYMKFYGLPAVQTVPSIATQTNEKTPAE